LGVAGATGLYFVKYSPEKRKIYVYDREGNFVGAFNSYTLSNLKKLVKKKENLINPEELRYALHDMIKVERDGGTLKFFYYYDEDFIRRIKEHGGTWDRTEKCWRVPIEFVTPKFYNDIVPFYRINSEKVKELLKQAIEENRATLGRSYSVSGYGEIPLPPGKRLYPFQVAGVSYAMKKDGRVLFGDEMGLGKTVQAIAYLNTLTKEEAFPAVVVCPSNMKYKWVDAFNEWSTHSPLKIEVLKKRNPFISGEADVYIVNYDILADKLPSLEGRIKTLILDEAHYVKNPRAKRTKAAFKLSQSVKRVMALTGTPVMNAELYEIYTICKIIRPDVFKSFTKFAEKYERNQKALNEFLRRTLMVRRLKKDVLQELPDKIRIPMKVEVDMKRIKEVEEEVKEKLREIKERKGEIRPTDKEVMAVLLPLFDKHRLISGIEKVPTVVDLAERIINEGNKVVIFAHHREVVNLLEKALKKKEITTLKIVGGMEDKKKYEVAREFNENEDIKALIASIQATAEGIDLTSASYAIFAQVDWTPAKNLQAEDRVHRIGQTQKVFSYWVIAQNTIDEHIVHKLLEKAKLIDKMVDMEDTGEELKEVAKRWTEILTEIVEELMR